MTELPRAIQNRWVTPRSSGLLRQGAGRLDRFAPLVGVSCFWFLNWGEKRFCRYSLQYSQQSVTLWAYEIYCTVCRTATLVASRCSIVPWLYRMVTWVPITGRMDSGPVVLNNNVCYNSCQRNSVQVRAHCQGRKARRFVFRQLHMLLIICFSFSCRCEISDYCIVALYSIPSILLFLSYDRYDLSCLLLLSR